MHCRRIELMAFQEVERAPGIFERERQRTLGLGSAMFGGVGRLGMRAAVRLCSEDLDSE
jgi:hypothetical protein